MTNGIATANYWTGQQKRKKRRGLSPSPKSTPFAAIRPRVSDRTRATTPSVQKRLMRSAVPKYLTAQQKTLSEGNMMLEKQDASP